MFRFPFASLPGRLLHLSSIHSNLVRFYRKMTTEGVIDKRIPDKWRDYEPCGVPIRGERIIAFKTPLSNRYDNESDLDNGIKPFERFTPMDLLNHINQKDMKLGMVIDFTNTNRYYNGQEFRNHGILYRKIKCIGKEIPSDDVVKRFKTEVCSFMANNSTGALIGVHCTHGLNRAGYIVCRYLIECRAYTPEKAIKAFNEARGYPMERDNYLQDLKTKTPKADDFSSLKEDWQRRRDKPSDRPRYIHTSAESFTRHVSSDRDYERIGRGRPQYNRPPNEYSDFESRYRNEDRYRFTDYNTETRNYTSRMFSTRERRDNHRDYDKAYDNYDNAYHNDDYKYNNYDNRYNSYNNYESYDHQHNQPRSRERSFGHDHVMKDKPYSSRDRSKPYSHQRTRYW